MLSCLTSPDKMHDNKLHGTVPWFSCQTPAEFAKSVQKGCSERENGESRDSYISLRGLQQSPTGGTEEELVAE